ncbi:uncharacterized protein LOC103792451 isoform X2 [Callithrix jacchus]
MTLQLQQSAGLRRPSKPHTAAPAPHHAEGQWPWAGGCGCGCGEREVGRGGEKALKCAEAGRPPSASSSKARLQGKQFVFVPEPRRSPAIRPDNLDRALRRLSMVSDTMVKSESEGG